MIKLTSSNGDVSYDQDTWVVDTVADLKTIPLRGGMGSTAFVIETSDVYMKNSKGQWVKI